MSLHWLNSLSDSFLPKAASHHTIFEEDKKRFWDAVHKDDPGAIDDIASRRPEYKTWESDDGSPLRSAQKWGCFESFVTLIGLGADINTDYGNGWTPLLTALKDHQDKFFMEFIFGSKPNLDVVAHDDKGRAYTALQLALDNRDADSVRALIERGANSKLEIETKDGAKMLPADYARAKKQPKLGELIDLAEEVKKMYDHRDDEYLSAQMEKPAAPAPVAPIAPKM